jgi:DNA gyrase subunit A
MIINRSGLTIRTSADQIRVAGRATQGVRVINLREGDSIASVTAVPKTEDDVAEVETAEGVVADAAVENVAESVAENAN